MPSAVPLNRPGSEGYSLSSEWEVVFGALQCAAHRMEILAKAENPWSWIGINTTRKSAPASAISRSCRLTRSSGIRLSAQPTRKPASSARRRASFSLAVAVTTRCDGCIVFHTDAALKAGATREEIAEALGVAVSMNAGAALIYSGRVLDAVEAKSAAHA